MTTLIRLSLCQISDSHGSRRVCNSLLLPVVLRDSGVEVLEISSVDEDSDTDVEEDCGVKEDSGERPAAVVD